MPNYICYCSMTDSVHIVTNDKGCGLCTAEDKARGITAENVDEAFKYLKEQIEADNDD